MKKDKFDIYLEDSLAENINEIEVLKDIDITPMDQMLAKVERELNNQNKVADISDKRNKKRFLRRIASVACILALASILSIAFNTTPVKAFKFNIIKMFTEVKGSFRSIFLSEGEKQQELITSNSDSEIVHTLTLEQAKKKKELSIPIPGYLPDNYMLDKILWTEYKNGENRVQQTYSNEDEKIVIQQISGFETIDISTISTEENKIENFDIMSTTGTLLYNDDSIYAIWLKDGIKYELFGKLSKTETKKILSKLK